MSSVRADRHLSVMASDFSAALDSIFDTNDNLFSLSVGLQQKKESIDHQSKELEALESQIRETEHRLKKAKRMSQQTLTPPPRSAEGDEQQPPLPPPQPQSPAQGNARPPRPSTTSRTSSSQSVPTSPALARPQSSLGNQRALVDLTQTQRPATSQRA